MRINSDKNQHDFYNLSPKNMCNDNNGPSQNFIFIKIYF